uniref:Rubredoxin-like domain-containing protein n=1 Tax=Coccolithus braarudii TaxID=221442 RepID=A0A7S0LHQ1_9EUKA|eukprot:CAMPEP_0183382238 /NCGR_PEP_ID=MMETSP0164_2-20130417/126842_1 /TAXON_ID=221442 /ORGANISM="Coccolithus pelagicus ssp braarudi, Strain PLY182g" /LENGTH=186 /DNA_ID=CAMNT_0025559853 /DNA_START=27 /DNA_END=587 /DNA_ORIENTATION=+
MLTGLYLALCLPALAHALQFGARAAPARFTVDRSSVRMLADETSTDFSFGEAGAVSAATVQVLEEEEEEMTEQQKEIARLKAAEKFMKKDTGDAVCRTCGFRFKMETGDGLIPRNTPFQLLPDNYVCPSCKSPKAFFDPVQIEIAGFEDNQDYGFGNAMTESQKSGLIFGGLGFAFALLMSGYALN